MCDLPPNFAATTGQAGTKQLFAELQAAWTAAPEAPPPPWAGEAAGVLALMWRSRQPMALVLGAQGLLVYNDAWVPLCGDLHPGGFGRPLDSAASTQAALLEPLVRSGYAGEAQAHQGLPWDVRRGGVPTRTAVDLSVTPLLGDDGAVQGRCSSPRSAHPRRTSCRRRSRSRMRRAARRCCARCPTRRRT
ncbi:MAG: hypothetical protein QM702_05005 [Rubrivivax sp.]